MMDSQDLYTYNALKVTTPQERELIKSIFTSKKESATAKLMTTGGIANHSMCYHHQGVRDCNTPLKSKLNGGQN